MLVQDTPRRGCSSCYSMPRSFSYRSSLRRSRTKRRSPQPCQTISLTPYPMMNPKTRTLTQCRNWIQLTRTTVYKAAAQQNRWRRCHSYRMKLQLQLQLLPHLQAPSYTLPLHTQQRPHFDPTTYPIHPNPTLQLHHPPQADFVPK